MSRRRRKKKKVNRIGVYSMMFVVLLLFCVLSYQTMKLKEKDYAYQQKEEELQKEITAQEARTEELDEYQIYVQTKQFIENMARQKLGLVNPDEILLRPE